MGGLQERGEACIGVRNERSDLAMRQESVIEGRRRAVFEYSSIVSASNYARPSYCNHSQRSP